MKDFAFDYRSQIIGQALVVLADCFDWLRRIPDDSIHAVVTDPPYGVKEYETDQLEKRENGCGGIWRIPPSFDGNARSPLPRFTALSEKEVDNLKEFFYGWSAQIMRVLRPGGHVFIASNAFMSQAVFNSIVLGGLEYRGEIIRLVRTLRGGDRPKNAEKEFSDVSTLPRSNYEPWGLFRKSIPKGMKVSDCLREFQTGGIRRKQDGKPLSDVVLSGRTPKNEKEIADHPTLKPQAFLRQLVYAALPLGEGTVLDPFMGSGSTIAAAEAVGYKSIGVERNSQYYEMSLQAIPRLSSLKVTSENLRQLPLPFDLE